MGYTWAQCTAYLRLARAERARHRVDGIVDQAAAFAGGDGARKLVKTLGEQGKV
jgi:hypothetical protein